MSNTVIAGKPSNTVGEKDSTLVLRGRSIKIQWGNKFIDLIKNGKINVDADKILKTANSVEDIKSDGIYLIEGSVWAVIGGTKIELSTKQVTTYISYLVDQDLDSEQKERALTNIGFYYDTFEEAEKAGLSKGIIYVQEDNKLYVVQNGKLNVYSQEHSTEEIKEEDIPLIEEGLYIKDYALWVNDKEIIIADGDSIIFQYKLITDYSGIESIGATSQNGYKLYINNQGESVLEIDNIIWRKHPIPITFKELYEKINDHTLIPKMYYLITDFQNPWEVTWENEPLFYEDYYDEQGRLAGKRNSQQLIVQAKTNNILEKEAFDLLHPDWTIYYDPMFLGPEYLINNSIQHGYRKRINDEGITEYLSCKGIITYLKDDLGNEGNFNFRCLQFKRAEGWRYCMDTNTGGVLGNFLEGNSNKFILESIEIYVQVFIFDPIYNDSGTISKYTLNQIDTNILISSGHNLVITSSCINNHFHLPNVKNAKHTIISSIENNKFININKDITIEKASLNNIFTNIEGNLTITINCNNNTITSFLDNVIIMGQEFNNNTLSNFKYNVNNTSVFSGNTINKCNGLITNSGNFSENNIQNIISDLSILKQFKYNNINILNNVIILGDMYNNTIHEITNSNINDNFYYNKFKCNIDNTTFNNISQDNISIGNISNCEFNEFINNKIYEDINGVKSLNINNCIFNQPINSLNVQDLFDCEFYSIDTLNLDIPVYYTTFHGHIGNITRNLTKYEKEWLQNKSKKTDVYPNIRVVCVPEIIIKGMIIMWHGLEIPKGWAICDGSNGTPDLRNRFIKAINTDGNGNIINSEGKIDPEDVEWDSNYINKFKLAKKHIPDHTHPHYHIVYGDTYTDTLYDDYVTIENTNTVVSGDDISLDSIKTTYEEENVSITIPDQNTSNAIYSDSEFMEDNEKITIEPKSYSMIFIMKIDEDYE